MQLLDRSVDNGDFNFCTGFKWPGLVHGFLELFDTRTSSGFQHERCERSVQMRLYRMHKRDYALLLLGLLVAIGIAIFVGLVGPPITLSSKIVAKEELNYTTFPAGPFGLVTPTLTTYHQQLWLLLEVQTKSQADEKFEKDFSMTSVLYGINDGKMSVIYTHVSSAVQHLVCPGGDTCNPLTLMHFNHIDFSKYVIVLQFNNLEAIHQRYQIRDYIFHFKTFNPSFTSLELTFRFLYSLTCYVIACWYHYNLRNYAVLDWSLEQKWTCIIILMLFLFNNPFFPLQLLLNSTSLVLLDSVLQVTFLCTLLLFWISLYHGILQIERRLMKFYLPKLIIVGSLWVVVLAIGSHDKLGNDTVYVYEMDYSTVNTLRIYLVVNLTIYFLALFYYMVKAHREVRSMPYLNLRLKFSTGFIFILFTVASIITYSKFGMDIIEEYFISELSTKYKSSAEFMSFYALMNLYVFALAYGYGPSDSVAPQIVRDNPSYSMVNDSDEDIVYVSDDEDSQVPLNQSRKPRINHPGDSD